MSGIAPRTEGCERKRIATIRGAISTSCGTKFCPGCSTWSAALRGKNWLGEFERRTEQPLARWRPIGSPAHESRPWSAPQDLERARVLLTGFVREDPRHAEAVTAAVLRLENLHRAAAPEALRLARRALGKSAR